MSSDIRLLIAKNIIWIDIFAFSLLVILILILWLSNHIYLQFLTSLVFINIGLFMLFMPFLKEYVLVFQYWLVQKIDDSFLQIVLQLFLTNPLFMEIIVFTIIFIVSLILSFVFYLGLIKPRYLTLFSLVSLKLNFWKIVYIPLFIIAIGYLTSLVVPFLGTKMARKSYFINFTYQVKINKLTERKSFIPILKKLYSSTEVLTDEKKSIPEKQKALIELSIEFIDLLQKGEKIEKLIPGIPETVIKEAKSLLLEKKDKKQIVEEILKEKDSDLYKLTKKAVENKEFINKVKEFRESSLFNEESLLRFLDLIL